MNYSKHYNNLINRSPKIKPKDGYLEKHHIVPYCLCETCPDRRKRKHVCGLEKSDNVVYLTPEEHYVAHQLLMKIYPHNLKLIQAANVMSISRKGNKAYGWLKRKFSKTQSGKNSHFHKDNTTIIYQKLPEVRLKMSLAKLGKKATIETKNKMSKARKGQPKNAQWRRNQSLSTKGKPQPNNANKLKLSCIICRKEVTGLSALSNWHKHL